MYFHDSHHATAYPLLLAWHLQYLSDNMYFDLPLSIQIRGGKIMAIVTTLYDLVDSVSEDYNDNETIVNIIQNIVNTAEAKTVKSSQKVTIVPQNAFLTESLGLQLSA